MIPIEFERFLSYGRSGRALEEAPSWEETDSNRVAADGAPDGHVEQSSKPVAAALAEGMLLPRAGLAGEGGEAGQAGHGGGVEQAEFGPFAEETRTCHRREAGGRLQDCGLAGQRGLPVEQGLGLGIGRLEVFGEQGLPDLLLEAERGSAVPDQCIAFDLQILEMGLCWRGLVGPAQVEDSGHLDRAPQVADIEDLEPAKALGARVFSHPLEPAVEPPARLLNRHDQQVADDRDVALSPRADHGAEQFRQSGVQ